MPPECYPATALIVQGTLFDRVLETVRANPISYPLIAKPDIGLRGTAVQKIENERQLQAYHDKAGFDYIVQQFIPYPNEIGIFYVRYPNESTGRITGMVAKEFLVVTGDGHSKIANLLQKDPRHAMQLRALRQQYGKRLDEIPDSGQRINLVPYGNHARGARFTDASALITQELIQTIDGICRRIPGFYFGRLDIMYDSWDNLVRGKKFLIVELNGAGSEPTHIYDPGHSIFYAWKELARHISYMYRISVANHKNGASYLASRAGMDQWREHRQHYKKLSDF